MRPTEILMEEHQVILTVLDAAEKEAARIRDGGKVDTHRLEMMVDFIRNFADRCHHAKEEKCLFPGMIERGIPEDGGPIGVMLAEHELGRGCVHALADAIPGAAGGNPEAVEQVLSSIASYVELLRGHIAKEDQVLFPMGDRVMTDQDQRDLMVAFETAEAEEMGPGAQEKYRQIAEELRTGSS